MKRRHKSASQVSRRHNKSQVNERLHFQKMSELNREIQKFKKSLENIRPKTREFKNIGIVKPSISTYSLCDSKSIDITNNRILSDFGSENDEKMPTHSLLPFSNDTNRNDIQCQHKNMNEHQVSVEAESNEAAMALLQSPTSIPFDCLLTEDCTANDINMKSFMHDSYTFSESGTLSPCSSTHTELRTVIRQQLNDDFEFIITPTIMVNVQDTIQSNLAQDFNDTRPFNSTSSRFFHRESKVAVNQHMSILIKKLTNEVVAEKSVNDSSGLSDSEQIEKNDIINEVLDNKSHENFMLLQRSFLQWVHFTTIEKLQRRNPAQSRLQKMEAFLQNITRERKRALNKLRRPGNVVITRRDDDSRQSKLYAPHMESPRFLTRTYNNK